ncbi:hypothetical protein PSHT_16515 [Puccinia striiformis]|uniref:Uncharacterized protein n=1 Tax=Puccinia striiformis TaxID=27350 RepID=A0A2S4U9L9_9BASI|nr:hypothetical protein PSHT_16515 [Puccinia striiformis]
MIGTILENYCLKSSEGLPDCGAKLLQEAAELFKAGVNLIRPFPAQRFKIPLLQDQHISTDAENNKDYYEEALEWVWTWVQNFILQSEEDQLWKILHPAAGLQTNRSDLLSAPHAKRVNSDLRTNLQQPMSSQFPSSLVIHITLHQNQKTSGWHVVKCEEPNQTTQ